MVRWLEERGAPPDHIALMPSHPGPLGPAAMERAARERHQVAMARIVGNVALGAIASAIPGLLVALAQSPHHFFLAVLVYLGVHVVEGYLVAPLIMRKAVEIKPALLLVGQGVFAAVFGILGVAIATPAIVCVQVGVEYLWVQRRLRKLPDG